MNLVENLCSEVFLVNLMNVSFGRMHQNVIFFRHFVFKNKVIEVLNCGLTF